MDRRESVRHGYRRLDFEFEGYPGTLVLPNEPLGHR